MKRFTKIVSVVLLIVILCSVNICLAQLATYTGSGGSSRTIVGVANETVTNLQDVGFGTNSACLSGGLSGKTVPTSYTTYTTAGPHYYFQILPNPGYQLNVTGFDAGMRRSGTGPSCARFAYSLDNGATWVDDLACHAPNNGGCATTAVSTWSGGTLPTAITSTTNGIIIAIFPYASSNNAGTFQTNTINVLGTVTVACPPPGPIVGVSSLCVGETGTMSNSVAGGTWSSNNTTVASIGSGSGIATGLAVGTSVISYTTGASCVVTSTLTVNALPASILGSMHICVGAVATLSDATAGGSWSAGNANITLGTSSGVVSGISAGTTGITYSLATGCFAVNTMTIDPVPASISGATSVCVGSSTTFSSSTGGGTWASSNANAGIGASSGIAGGLIAGTSVISYSLSTGCGASVVLTVNPLPSSISGTVSVCTGFTTSLGSSTGGGTWSSSNGNATIGTAAGLVNGITAGTSIISYTLGTGCFVTRTVTVSQSPSAISGQPTVCVGTSATLSSPTAGGTWTRSNTNVTIGASNGVFSGLVNGSTIITYSTANGCFATYNVSVNPLPTPISGPLSVCVGASVTLSSSTVGGTWSSSSTNATIGISNGIVTGSNAGTALLTYTMGSGCTVSSPMTINAMPGAISGPTGVCIGQTATLATTSTGGLWSATGGHAIVGGGTGYTTGTSAGTSTITYTGTNGCYVSTLFTVYSLPAAVSGILEVCAGATTSLSNVSSGGTWSTTAANVAIGSLSGALSGITAGTALITYSLGTGCTSFATATVDPLPAGIAGTPGVCVGSNTFLSNPTLGGTWSSSNGNASAGVTSGAVTGINAGNATISYILTTGCSATLAVTVLPLPSAITGPTAVCVGASTALYSSSPLGTWSSSNTNITVTPSTGVISGFVPGTSTVTYRLGTGCAVSTVTTVNPLPAPISGSPNVCVGVSVTLNDADPGGTWTTSNGNTSAGLYSGAIGGIIPGASTITYTLPTGCRITTPMTVIPTPPSITGPASICMGNSASYVNAMTGGSWSSSNPNLIIGLTTGFASGISPGTATINYATTAGCSTSRIVTVDPLLGPNSGNTNTCLGSITILSNPTAGGAWSSSNTNASVNPGTGVVTGLAYGTSTITYSTPSGCISTTVVSVISAPLPITGVSGVCIGQSSSLNDATPGGAWTINNLNSSIDPLSGVVTGVSTGTSQITYSLGISCSSYLTFTVFPTPGPIVCPPDVCAWGATFNASDATPSGFWSSTLITINSVGHVTSFAPGVGTITYSLPTGCSSYATVVVDPLPLPITGITRTCVGLTTTLSDMMGGGTWSAAGIGSHGSVDMWSGVVTGLSAGTQQVSYILPTGCLTVQTITVVPVPSLLTGIANVCVGNTTVLTDSVSGGTWSGGSLILSVSPITAASASVNGLVAGTADVTYNMAPACMQIRSVTVLPLPGVYSVTGGGSYCNGGLGVHIRLGGSSSGIRYGLYTGSTLAATSAGSGSALDFGLFTVPGTYIVHATDTVSGCATNMSGSGTVAVIPVVTPSVSLTVSPGILVCAGTPVLLTATPAFGGSAPAYQFTLNGVNVGSTVSTYTYTPANGDLVNVVLTSNAPCASPSTSSAVLSMSVETPVPPIVSIVASPGTTFTAGQTVSFTTSVTGGGVSPVYQWQLNGFDIAGATTSNFTSNLLEDNDTVTCNVLSSTVCHMAGSSYQVMKIKLPSVGTTTLKNGSTDVFNVMPNPSKGEFKLTGSLASSSQTVIINVTNMMGQVVFRKTVDGGQRKINEQIDLGETINDGVYLLSVSTNEGQQVFHVTIQR